MALAITEWGTLQEDAYIEGYLALTLDIIKQVVHDRKKGHVLVSDMPFL